MKDFLKKIVIIIAVAIATLGGMVAIAFFVPNNNSTNTPTNSNSNWDLWGGVSSAIFGVAEEVENIELKFVQSHFDGVLTPEDLVEKPLNVMVENHPFARPQQSGLAEAQIVREALTEGGITRFMLTFGRDYPERVGPVRSARPYFVEWASELGGIYAHAGGSDDALMELYTSDLIDADEDAIGMSRDLAYTPPHNLFLDVNELAEDNLENENWLAQDFNVFEFCSAAGCDYAEEEIAEIISVNFSTEPSYDVTFTYDPENNFYIREQNNYPNGEEITPRNLIIQYAPWENLGDEKGHIEIYNIGEGEADLFVDGVVIHGAWRKDSATSRTIFYDPETLEEWQLEIGQTWIMVVGDLGQVVVE